MHAAPARYAWTMHTYAYLVLHIFRLLLDLLSSKGLSDQQNE